VFSINGSKDRQKNKESKVYELEARLEVLEQSVKEKADTKDVIVKVDKLIKEKELITKAELTNLYEKMEKSLHENQVKLLKWMLATGVSSIAAIAGIIRIFAM
jgi:uracil phosphoribosyltransferase